MLGTVCGGWVWLGQAGEGWRDEMLVDGLRFLEGCGDVREGLGGFA